MFTRKFGNRTDCLVFNDFVHIDDDFDMFKPLPSDEELCGLQETVTVFDDDDAKTNGEDNVEIEPLNSHVLKSYLDSIGFHFDSHRVSNFNSLNEVENQVNELILSNFKQLKISIFF